VKPVISVQESMFHFWLNTFFVVDEEDADFIDMTLGPTNGEDKDSTSSTGTAGDVPANTFQTSQSPSSWNADRGSRKVRQNAASNDVLVTSGKKNLNGSGTFPSAQSRTGVSDTSGINSVRVGKHGGSVRNNLLSSSFSGSLHDVMLDAPRSKISPPRETVVDRRFRKQLASDSSSQTGGTVGSKSTYVRNGAVPSHTNASVGSRGLNNSRDNRVSSPARVGTQERQFSNSEDAPPQYFVGTARPRVQPQASVEHFPFTTNYSLRGGGRDPPASSGLDGVYRSAGFDSSNPASPKPSTLPGQSTKRVQPSYVPTSPPLASNSKSYSAPSFQVVAPPSRRYLTVTLTKPELDKANKDGQHKLYSADFKVFTII